jgi:hypothetical protein
LMISWRHASFANHFNDWDLFNVLYEYYTRIAFAKFLCDNRVLSTIKMIFSDLPHVLEWSTIHCNHFSIMSIFWTLLKKDLQLPNALRSILITGSFGSCKEYLL